MGDPGGPGSVHRIEDDDGERAPWGSSAVEIYAALRASHVRLGESEIRAGELALAGVLAMADLMGGRRFYLPRAMKLRNRLRDHDIRAGWNGWNEAELADAHNVTVSRIMQILRATE